MAAVLEPTAGLFPHLALWTNPRRGGQPSNPKHAMAATLAGYSPHDITTYFGLVA